jgi:hypothetical protein
LILREPPAPGARGVPLCQLGEDALTAAARWAKSMQASTLCIQGPPGTGKTFTAAHAINALLQQGRRVGITSNSHKAIENLLRECHRQNPQLRSLYVTNGGEEIAADCPGVTIAKSIDAFDAYEGGLVAGTAWLFAREEWAGALDHLFIDEAGQVCLANTAAVASAAGNLVILGDQMQLEQPVQGAHPGESGRSALDYYLEGHATVPPELGLFLGVTHRLHPEICQFISDLVYEGRLQPALGNASRKIFVGRTALAGIRFMPVEHEGNCQACNEEVAAVVALARQLLGAAKFGPDGRPAGTIGLEDILLIAPYNAQVRRLRAALPNARVGSIDRFQGQQADVVILSMCSSFGEYGSRGLDFILDKNRMNVALSRALSLAVVIGDPRIATSPGESVDAMRRINLYCRLVRDHGEKNPPGPAPVGQPLSAGVV